MSLAGMPKVNWRDFFHGCLDNGRLILCANFAAPVSTDYLSALW